MDILSLDHQHIWHPASQMQDYASFPPMIIKKAAGSYIELQDGRRILDAISSWWCKSLGHAHPRLKTALMAQLEQFEHVIFAGTTYPAIVQLSEKLASLTPTLDKVFFASDGACAVEIAVKMSLHSQQILGHSKRKGLMALEKGYHGETILAGALTDDPILHKHYGGLMPEVGFIKDIPYVSSRQDPLWKDCSALWPNILKQLEVQADTLAAIICEPIVQGAAGMQIYSQDFLVRLRQWTKAHGVYLIADEIMTGLGRTGKKLASDHAGIEADFVCLSKGLTAGFLPMSVVLTSPDIYALFYGDYAENRNFLHSHTHSGNALAAAVALECFKVLEDENSYQSVCKNEDFMASLMQEVAEKTGKLKNLRYIGGIVAADLKDDTHKGQRLGYTIYKKAVEQGILLRPLGNTIYWLPPFNIAQEDLYQLRDRTIAAIEAVDF